MASRATAHLHFDDVKATASLDAETITLSGSDGNSLTLSIPMALRILSLAEASGRIPDLPEAWWQEVRYRYGAAD